MGFVPCSGCEMARRLLQRALSYSYLRSVGPAILGPNSNRYVPSTVTVMTLISFTPSGSLTLWGSVVWKCIGLGNTDSRALILALLLTCSTIGAGQFVWNLVSPSAKRGQ